jgi:hypothetical protein
MKKTPNNKDAFKVLHELSSEYLTLINLNSYFLCTEFLDCHESLNLAVEHNEMIEKVKLMADEYSKKLCLH